MRAVALSATKAGITRLREKGGADPETLYDLVNGYVNAARAPTARHGTVLEHTLPAGTKGLVYFDEKFVVFAASSVEMTDPDYRCEALAHPTSAAADIATIHFAAPFLGYLYVVVEFDNGDVFHYLTRTADQWAADTAHDLGDMVQPTIPNGYLYRAHRLNPAGVTWAAGVSREVGDVLEPTVFTGWEHTVTTVIGANPRSGTTEPDWAETDGGITIEDTGLTVPPPPTTGTTTPPTTKLPHDVRDRYGDFRDEQ